MTAIKAYRHTTLRQGLINYQPGTVRQAWMNLASDILLLAIWDVRQMNDSYRKAKAKEWLLSPAAQLIFESIGIDVNLKEWVMADCPSLDND